MSNFEAAAEVAGKAPAALSASESQGSSDSSARILIRMRVALHVMFALLLALGVYRTLTDALEPSALRVTLVLIASVLGLVYLAGTVLEKRFVQGRIRLAPPRRRFAELSAVNVRRATRIWFSAVYVLWGILALFGENFIWLAFPIFFLCLHVLGPRWGLLGIAVTVLVANLQVLTGGTTFAAPAALLGTMIGAAIAISMSSIYRALLEETRAQKQALEELLETRSDLAFAERQAVRLAEREHIAAQVHDTIAQDLASIVLMSRSAEQRTPLVTTIEASAQSALENTRKLVRELGVPTSHIDARLQEAVSQVRAQASIAAPNLEIDLVFEGEPVALPDNWQDALHNATRACLSNVLLHAKASRAVVTLSYFSSGVRLDIVDDGQGFGMHGLPPAAGRGLDLLRRRVRALGGNLDVHSTWGHDSITGTTITVELGMNDEHN